MTLPNLNTASGRNANRQSSRLQRAQARVDQRHQQDLARGEQAANARGIRRSRNQYINSVSGLTNEQRYDLQTSSRARAHAGDWMLPDQAKRLAEFEQALVGGASSVQAYRTQNLVNRSAEAQVGQQEAVTNYLPMSMVAELRGQQANTGNTRSLTRARDADTGRRNAIAPLQQDQLHLQNDQLRAVAPRVEDGSVLPPNHKNDIRVPRGLTALDEAKAFDLETRGLMNLQAIDQASREPRPDYAERIRALETVVDDDTASSEERDEARRMLAEIGIMEDMNDFTEAQEVNINDAVATYEDGEGRKVYQTPDGRYIYQDGREYRDPTQIMNGG